MATGGPARAAQLDPEWFEMQADMMRVMSNPKRLMILDVLKSGKRTVTEISTALGMSIQNTSQHLRVMRAQRIVRPERDGQVVRYEVTSPVLGRCCGLVRELLIEQARARGERVALAVPARKGARVHGAGIGTASPHEPLEGVGT